MSSPLNPTSPAQAAQEARDLFDRLGAATRRDRAAFTLGFTLAFDAMADDLTDAEFIRIYHRVRGLQAICAEDFR